jgi:hypothetical protein
MVLRFRKLLHIHVVSKDNNIALKYMRKRDEFVLPAPHICALHLHPSSISKRPAPSRFAKTSGLGEPCGSRPGSSAFQGEESLGSASHAVACTQRRAYEGFCSYALRRTLRAAADPI